MIDMSEVQLELVKEFFSHPKHKCPSCTCQCAIIPRNRDLSSKVTFISEKGNQVLICFNNEKIMVWLPKIIMERYFNVETASSFKIE